MQSISQAAAQIGVSAPTLRRWDRNGTFKAYRTAGNHRRYNLAEILLITCIFLLLLRIKINPKLESY
ncbi:MAG: MerR family transcriptional regulator [Candidatus Lokiarchaeota archaeon]|nr:MerR family transcriptional regulator [Candidatus Lokiarchaeota archaeon]